MTKLTGYWALAPQSGRALAGKLKDGMASVLPQTVVSSSTRRKVISHGLQIKFGPISESVGDR